MLNVGKQSQSYKVKFLQSLPGLFLFLNFHWWGSLVARPRVSPVWAGGWGWQEGSACQGSALPALLPAGATSPVSAQQLSRTNQPVTAGASWRHPQGLQDSVGTGEQRYNIILYSAHCTLHSAHQLFLHRTTSAYVCVCVCLVLMLTTLWLFQY